MAPQIRGFDLSLSAYKEYRHILSREEYPYIYDLTAMIIREIEDQQPQYQESAMGLLLSLCIQLDRIQSKGASRPRSRAGLPRMPWYSRRFWTT